MGWLSPLIGGGMHMVSQALGDWFQSRRLKEAMSSKVLLDAVANTQGPEQIQMADLAAPKLGLGDRWPRSAPTQTFTPEGGNQPLNLQQVSALGQGAPSTQAFNVGEGEGKPMGLPSPDIHHLIARAISQSPEALQDYIAKQTGTVGKPEFVTIPGVGTVGITPKPGMVLPENTKKFGQTDPYALAQFKEKIRADRPEKLKTTIKEMMDPADPNGPPKLFLMNSQTGDVIKQVGVGKAGGEKDFSPEGVDMMARNFIQTGNIPGLGLGAAATKARKEIINTAAQIMSKEGLTPTDIQTNKIVFGGLKAEMSRLKGQEGPMLAFAKTADKNLDIALDLSGKVGRMGSPVINRWILAGRKSIAGDPDVAAFDAAIRVGINEFAKVTSSASGGGVTSDQARKDIENILHSAQTPKQFQKVVKEVLRPDMQNRITGYQEQTNTIGEAIKRQGQIGGGSPKPAGEANVQGGASKLPQVFDRQSGQMVTVTQEQYDKLKAAEGGQ